MRASMDDSRHASDSALHWHETLRDGTRVLIRPIQKEDAAIERAFLERLSAGSRAFRFHGEVKVSDAMIKRLTDVNCQRDMAFVALRHDEGEKREIGVCRFCVSDDGRACECAVAIGDEWQGRGLGYLLMCHLIEVARQRGIEQMIAIVSTGNRAMGGLATSLGFEPEDARDYPGEIVYRLKM